MVYIPCLFLFNLALVHVVILLRLPDLLWYIISYATWPLKWLLLLLVNIERSAAAAHAVAVFIGLLLRLHVSTSHIWHLVPFMARHFRLIYAELTEIVFEVGIVLQTHNRVLVLHDLLAAHVVCSELLVSI